MTAKSDTEKMRDTIKWAIAIMITLFLALITWAVRAGTETSKNSEDIEVIRRDYLPYFAFEYIVESNNKLMNIVQSIDFKDDKRYEKAIKEWNDLQQEVVKQAGKNKTRNVK
jgi:hypothetical protein